MCLAIPRDFVDSFKSSIISLNQVMGVMDHHLLVAGRNKIWANEIKKVVGECDGDMTEIVVMSGFCHIPGLIVELDQMGVQFSEDVLQDSYNWVSAIQMPIDRVSYHMLLQLNERLPAANLDFLQPTQIEEGVLVKYQEDRELSGAHNVLDECTS
jgi:hypothetical protein